MSLPSMAGNPLADTLIPLSNSELSELARLIHENREKEADHLERRDWQRLSDLRDRLLAFLWIAASHLTADPQVARQACLGARDAFLERFGWKASLTPLGRAVNRLIWRLQTPRTWLLRSLREKVGDTANGWRSPSAWPLPNEAIELPPAPLQVLADLRAVCQLRAHRRSRELCKHGHCQRLCDVLFLRTSLDLSMKELGLTFGLPQSTAAQRLYECEGTALELRSAKQVAPRSTQPSPRPVS